MISMQILPLFFLFAVINLSYTALAKTDNDLICAMRDYVPQLAQLKDEKQLEEIEKFGRKYANSIGFHHETKRHWKWTSEPISPFPLVPFRYPRKSFDMAMQLQPAMNLLYFRASFDYDFLNMALGEMAKSDDFVKTILDIMHEMKQENGYQRQPISMHWQRADYMLHVNEQENECDNNIELKQIEVNCSAASGMPMSQHVTKIHRQVLKHMGLDASPEALRENNPFPMIAEGFLLAWLKFADPNAVVLSIMYRSVESSKMSKMEVETRQLFERFTGGKMQFVYLGIEECDEKLTLDPEDFSLRLEDGRKVAIADYRILVRPKNKPVSEKVKRVLRKIERSTAIKHPTVGSYLMDLKKVQQVLAKPGMVERFFTKPEEAHYAKAIRQTFAGLWGLDSEDEETKAIIEDAKANPDRYVLKPCKEGGGNNFFGEDIVKKLEEFTPEERTSHILMQRVKPPVVQNYLIEPYIGERPKPKFGEMVIELGTYGMLVGNSQDGTILYNHGQGYMARSKFSHSDEGGIFEGAGFYDSPYLF